MLIFKGAGVSDCLPAGSVRTTESGLMVALVSSSQCPESYVEVGSFVPNRPVRPVTVRPAVRPRRIGLLHRIGMERVPDMAGLRAENLCKQCPGRPH
jgi:hypothetical protein